MDMIQSFQDNATEYQSYEDASMRQKYSSEFGQSTESSYDGGSFDCNICFECAYDPVVTLCGHLYCWACIFQWLNVQNPSSELVQRQACPVCKAKISQASLVPLYCNGPSQTDPDLRKPHRDVIPPRPTAPALHTLMAEARPNQLPTNPLQSPAFHHHRYLSDPFSNYATIASSNNVSTTMAGIINPTIGLLSELVNPRMFGSADTSMFTFPLPSSYAVIRHSNPRTRRQELQVNKSLNRVSIFLFCCLLLCLLLF